MEDVIRDDSRSSDGYSSVLNPPTAESGGSPRSSSDSEDQLGDEMTEYVDAVLPRIRACGFRLVNALPGGTSAGERIGNTGLESGLWVKLSVGGFNVTRWDETDDAVWCLHGIGG
ncbi:hypothetical protein MMYC01_205059 [Madurella mycetomatis]|uniref:Uncharacterized protein n=1 Tax=Madurella mycetomatis TaxID=100816 RepID=A0A175W3A9_9PEZI|nr:hypothetical protein MMYC01_205059 [Madurella mycetomatis]